MNERIKELAKQAEFSENELHIQGDNFQMFAELIVRECAEICFEIDREYSYEDVLATWCGDGILKHFGV